MSFVKARIPSDGETIDVTVLLAELQKTVSLKLSSDTTIAQVKTELQPHFTTPKNIEILHLDERPLQDKLRICSLRTASGPRDLFLKVRSEPTQLQTSGGVPISSPKRQRSGSSLANFLSSSSSSSPPSSSASTPREVKKKPPSPGNASSKSSDHLETLIGAPPLLLKKKSESSSTLSASSSSSSSPSKAQQRKMGFGASASPSSKSSSSIMQLFSIGRRSSSETALDEGIKMPTNLESELKSRLTTVTKPPNWALEEESTLIQPGEGWTIEVGDKSLPAHSPEGLELEIEPHESVPIYQDYFASSNHENFLVVLEDNTPLVASVQKSQEGSADVLIRVPEGTQFIQLNVAEKKLSNTLKQALQKANLGQNAKTIQKVRDSSFVNDLVEYEQGHVVKKYKFGILFMQGSQVTEDEWFGNQHGSPGFEDFLTIMGTRIVLKGWEKFRGGLDVNGDTTGTHSVYTKYQSNEVMFHVSTLLPFMPDDAQKIERKRHLGNDIVVIVYKEGSTRFPPSIVKSVFNHHFVVVQRCQDDPNWFTVGVAMKSKVKRSGPALPFPPRIHQTHLREFLLLRLLNAEWAAYRSPEFAKKLVRTRQMQLDSFIQKYNNK